MMHFDNRDREEAERAAWRRVTDDAAAFNKHYSTHLTDEDFAMLVGEDIISDAHLRRVVERIVEGPVLFPNPARILLDESEQEG